MSTATITSRTEYRELLIESVESESIDREAALQAASEAGFSKGEFESHLARLLDAHRVVSASAEAQAAEQELGELEKGYRAGVVAPHIYDGRRGSLRLRRRHAQDELQICRTRLVDLCPNRKRQLAELVEQAAGCWNQEEVFSRKCSNALDYHGVTETGSKYRQSYTIATLREKVQRLRDNFQQRDEAGSAPKVTSFDRSELAKLESRIYEWERANEQVQQFADRRAKLESQAEELRQQLKDWRNVELF